MPRLSLSRLALRDLLAVGLPLLLVVVAAFWFAGRFVKPAPPTRFVMTTGSESGTYHASAEQYRRILARHGIDLVLRPSAGASENLARLLDPDGEVEAGFVQGGLAEAQEDAPVVLESLGSTHYEPVWVFYRAKSGHERLTDLRGKRIAIGAAGSGTYDLATRLLAANEIDASNATLVAASAENAAAPLLEGELDAIVHVASPRAGIVASLFYAPNVRLMSFSRGAAYTQLFPYLSTVVLPQSSINLVRDIPPADTQLIATSAFVLVRESLHPALRNLLLQAMAEVHQAPGPLARAREFPALRESGFPHATEAERFHRNGPPLLQRYLPFWAASLADRMLVLLVPLFAVLVPLLRIAPPLYTWRVRSKINRLYGELKFLEHEIRERFESARLADYRAELDRLEVKAYSRPIPLGYTDQVYTLRGHIGTVRELLAKRQGEATAAPS